MGRAASLFRMFRTPNGLNPLMRVYTDERIYTFRRVWLCTRGTICAFRYCFRFFFFFCRISNLSICTLGAILFISLFCEFICFFLSIFIMKMNSKWLKNAIALVCVTSFTYANVYDIHPRARRYKLCSCILEFNVRYYYYYRLAL